MHARDMMTAVRIEFPDGCPGSLLLTVDQCEDNNPENLKTQLADFDVFLDLKLGLLVRVWHAPGSLVPIHLARLLISPQVGLRLSAYSRYLMALTA